MSKKGLFFAKWQNFKNSYFFKGPWYDCEGFTRWKHILWVHFGPHIMDLHHELQKPPTHLDPPQKRPFLEGHFSLQLKNPHFWSTLVDQNFFSSKTPNSPLQNPNFVFFIFWILLEISYFQFLMIEDGVFK